MEVDVDGPKGDSQNLIYTLKSITIKNGTDFTGKLVADANSISYLSEHPRREYDITQNKTWPPTEQSVGYIKRYS